MYECLFLQKWSIITTPNVLIGHAFDEVKLTNSLWWNTCFFSLFLSVSTAWGLLLWKLKLLCAKYSHLYSHGSFLSWLYPFEFHNHNATLNFQDSTLPIEKWWTKAILKRFELEAQWFSCLKMFLMCTLKSLPTLTKKCHTRQ